MKRTYCIFAAHYLPHLGGVERYTYNIAKKLSEKGNKVVIVTSQLNGTTLYEKTECADIYRLPCVEFMGGRFPVPKLNKDFRRIYKKLKEIPIDLVIINARFYFHSVLGVRFAKKKNIKSILLDHGTAHMIVGNKVLDKIGELYEHCLTTIEKQYCKDYYGVSQASAEWLKHFHIQAKGVLYNSIDIEDILSIYNGETTNYRELYHISKETVVITYTGRLIKEKGILQLIKSVENLYKEGIKICLFIAGDGELDALVNERASEFVVPLGRISFSEVVALLKQTDIFCLPTEYPEGFPTSTLEAMACKCYPIVTANGGAEELIISSEYGEIIRDNSVNVISDALKKAIRDEQRRKKCVENAYQRVSDCFVWDKVASKVENMTTQI